MQKKNIQSGWNVVILCVCLFWVSVSAQASSVPDHITLTWMEDPQTTQTITWQTDNSVDAGQVEYMEALSNTMLLGHVVTVPGKVSILSTNLGEMVIHTATLINLKPGTRYLYRLGHGLNWSIMHTFVTAPANTAKFEFFVFGDSQSISYDTWQATLYYAYQSNPNAAFIINMGDLVDVGQDYANWDKWHTAAAGVIDTIPIVPVTGNHETYTPEGEFSMPVLFTGQFKLPANGPSALQGQVYSFTYGNVHFSVLDSQSGEEARFVPSMLEIQRDWLARDLQLTDARWKIVLVHRPPYNNKENNDNNNIRDAFVPLFDQYHVDVVFTAHDHVYARTYPLNHGEVVADPAKGTIYVATGRSGSKTYDNTLANEWDEFFYNPLDQPNYISVEVDENCLLLKAFQQDGTIIDAWGINKAI
ncbi:MAG: metallophosphoesterase family protein [Bacillota bacterium]|nr:metallophosphoesterase family protein [Bacillota bacterium]